MNNALAPFSCTYTPQIPELLSRLNCSIAITTYQAGKLIFISPKDENSLVQLPRTFEKPMGIAEDMENDRLAIATKDEIVILANSEELAAHYPNAPQKYDALYMPRATYHTGTL
ncbi:MAG: TIGR03032 family protein, partial [Bacteroidia bacterium]|nr:TIGR03032 family protein [Bacteroidia bacterium]